MVFSKQSVEQYACVCYKTELGNKRKDNISTDDPCDVSINTTPPQTHHFTWFN